MRVAFVKKLAIPPVFAVNKSHAVPNAAVCSEFTLLVKAVNVAAIVVFTPALPILIAVALVTPKLNVPAANVSTDGVVSPSVKSFVPVKVLLLESNVVPALSVD